jgi:hypothetical protein
MTKRELKKYQHIYDYMFRRLQDALQKEFKRIGATPVSQLPKEYGKNN